MVMLAKTDHDVTNARLTWRQTGAGDGRAAARVEAVSKGTETMDIHPIHNEDDLRAALARVDAIWGAADGTPEADELEALAVLIEDYETKHYPMPPVEPVEYLKAFMEHTGRTQSDLVELFGSASGASEVLNKRRALTMEMVHKLATEWKIPADALVKPYSIASRAQTEADEDAADIAAYDAAKADLAAGGSR